MRTDPKGFRHTGNTDPEPRPEPIPEPIPDDGEPVPARKPKG